MPSWCQYNITRSHQFQLATNIALIKVTWASIKMPTFEKNRRPRAGSWHHGSDVTIFFSVAPVSCFPTTKVIVGQPGRYRSIELTFVLDSDCSGKSVLNSLLQARVNRGTSVLVVLHASVSRRNCSWFCARVPWPDSTVWLKSQTSSKLRP
jgi:hypothetical protein